MSKLRHKYNVESLETGRVAGSVNFEDEFPYFVLSPERDPAAYEAVKRYAEVCEPELADEIRWWLAETAMRYHDGKMRLLGEIGEENAEHMKSKGLKLFDDLPFNEDTKIVFLED